VVTLSSTTRRSFYTKINSILDTMRFRPRPRAVKITTFKYNQTTTTSRSIRSPPLLCRMKRTAQVSLSQTHLVSSLKGKRVCVCMCACVCVWRRRLNLLRVYEYDLTVSRSCVYMHDPMRPVIIMQVYRRGVCVVQVIVITMHCDIDANGKTSI